MSEFECENKPLRNIRVTGTAKVSAEPDLAIITFNISSKATQYKSCMDILYNRTQSLREELVSVGLGRAEIKTTRFNVDTNYEYDKQMDKRYFRGYKATHDLKVEFPFTPEYLNQVLNVLSYTETQTSFKISFRISDPEPLRQQALANAIKNCKEKAEILTQAAGVSLEEIISINYSWDEVYIRPARELCEVESLASEAAYDITPEDIDISDTVTINWSIK